MGLAKLIRFRLEEDFPRFIKLVHILAHVVLRLHDLNWLGFKGLLSLGEGRPLRLCPQCQEGTTIHLGSLLSSQGSPVMRNGCSLPMEELGRMQAVHRDVCILSLVLIWLQVRLRVVELLRMSLPRDTFRHF